MPSAISGSTTRSRAAVTRSRSAGSPEYGKGSGVTGLAPGNGGQYSRLRAVCQFAARVNFIRHNPRMAAVKPSPGRVDRKLQLGEVLDWLVADRVVDAASVARLQEDAKVGRTAARHPLVLIPEARIRSLSGKPLNSEFLTEWLAGRLKLPYYHIDPLKIDLKGVTEVMSAEYAQRRGILPVAVSGREVTIATSEPFITSWERELAEMLKLSITRVLANPADIERYQREFFNLARSMKRAESVGVPTSGLTNFEQLVELG